MTTITIDVPTTTNVMKNTEEEVDDVLNAINKLNSYRVWI